jgi:hypothetical protein
MDIEEPRPKVGTERTKQHEKEREKSIGRQAADDGICDASQ